MICCEMTANLFWQVLASFDDWAAKFVRNRQLFDIFKPLLKAFWLEPNLRDFFTTVVTIVWQVMKRLEKINGIAFGSDT